MAEKSDEAPVDVALCIDGEVYSRLWNVIRHLCVGLVDLTARVRLLSSSRAAEALTLGPIQLIIHQDLVWPLRRQRTEQIIEVLSARPPTVVHAISRGSFRVAQSVAQAFDIELVLQVTAAKDVKALDRVDGQRVQHVVAASRPLVDLVERSGRVRPEAVSLIRPGALRSEQPTCFRQPGARATLLCTTDFEEHSGVDELIRAVRILRDRGYELLTFLLGQGRRERKLRELAQAQKVSPWITFARPKADLVSIMSGADIFVRPAAEWAINCNSLLAMATGTVVVTCSGGVTDHCLDGRTAIVCSEPDPESLADGIERLLRDHTYARTLASAGIAHIKEYHPLSTMAEQTLALYQRLALRRKTFAIQE